MKSPESESNERNFISEMVNTLIEEGKTNPRLFRTKIEKYIERLGGMESFLQAFADNGYLLHGSNEQIEKFEPRVPQARKGIEVSPENAVKAVYASTESQLPILMAIVSRKLIREASKERVERGKSVVYFGAKEGGYYSSCSLHPFMRNGFVYVFNRDQFVSSDPDDPNCAQFVSEHTVSPILIIPVIPEDFMHEIKIVED